MAGIDLTVLGTAVAGVGTVAAAIWAWWQQQLKIRANTRAEVAESDASRVVADSQQTVYRLLVERVTTLESDVRTLRSELSTERAHGRHLELHIWKLEGLMRQAGLEIPPFDGGSPDAKGMTTS